MPEAFTASFRARALTAAATSEQSKVASKQKSLMKALAEFEIDPSAINWLAGGAGEIDGIVLRAANGSEFDRTIYVHVQGACPNCGELCWSPKVINLEGIGRYVANFQPVDHGCSKDPWRLDNLISEMVAQAVSEAGSRG